MLNISKKLFAFALSFVAFSISATAQQVINIAHGEGDMTLKVREALEKATSDEVKIVIEKGTYSFKPDYAFEKYCALTNHGNGLKKILFPMKGFKKVEIEGNGAELIFHGMMMPFLFEYCNEVKVSDVTIDWDIPYLFEGDIVATNAQEGWVEVKPYTEGYSWKFAKGEITYPNIDGFSYEYLGSTLFFDKETKRVVNGAIDMHSVPTKIEDKGNGVYRLYQKTRYTPPVGAVWTSKGDRAHDRYAPAFDFKECQNIVTDGIIIHHALGMGFLYERSENISILNSQIVVRKGSSRVVSSTADATHFANCKGDVLIENCRFENMIDDGTNVHGTYMNVAEVVDNHTLRVNFHHFEQLGFNFAEKGDEMWFILQPSPSRAATGVVKDVKVLNELYMDITFEDAIPSGMKVGDVVENKTWNPVFTMRGCTIQNHRARNVVIKTPLKCVIEDNHFSSMMSAILFRGEMFTWYESGAVGDVLIQNNYFKNCADCGTKHAVLYITPRFNNTFDVTEQYDKNIRFINNTIDTYVPAVVIADRVDGLVIKGNKIIQNSENTPAFPNAPMFELENSINVTIEGNEYTGSEPFKVLEMDEASKEGLKLGKNKGFKF
ncbi:MAG: right-handed parallel beta-helix repeat-containing protein [Rikenellaceae bacterium]